MRRKSRCPVNLHTKLRLTLTQRIELGWLQMLILDRIQRSTVYVRQNRAELTAKKGGRHSLQSESRCFYTKRVD